MRNSYNKYTQSLKYHEQNKPGKIAIIPTKPLLTSEDLALAYSPGVAGPCLAINEDASNVYRYTAKANQVAVITNGTAVLGLGNLGAMASKPVMEGKAVLFKRFADIDAIDIEVDTQDTKEFIHVVKYIAKTWGGINLEDIKSPECFIIERELQKLVDIPVFHDDQHGTAIIVAAALINAADITSRNFKNMKIILNGSGAAGIACITLLKSMGVNDDNITICDRSGVIYKGRKNNMNQWKELHAIDTKARTLEDALVGADVFLGLSAANIVKPEMIKKMNKNPIIFAMANPDPEIKPELAKEVRPDAIVATGRSDYPNQANNIMGFPYIFRGALDVRAKSINLPMKIAAVNALAELARLPVVESVKMAYKKKDMEYGKNYIIPTPFDPRLIEIVSSAVAKAAINSNVARKEILDFEIYKKNLRNRLSYINMENLT